MSAAPLLSPDNRAAESVRTIGEVVCLYVHLELSMRRFIDVLAYPPGVVNTDVLVAKHRFQPPLRSLRLLIVARYADDTLKLRKFRRWRNRVDKLLARRNTMIHGSWIDEQGSLRFSRYPRCEGAHARESCGQLSAYRLASDMRLLEMDIAAIKAWIGALKHT